MFLRRLVAKRRVYHQNSEKTACSLPKQSPDLSKQSPDLSKRSPGLSNRSPDLSKHSSGFTIKNKKIIESILISAHGLSFQ